MLPDERTDVSVDLLHRAQLDAVYVPSLWQIEVANILAVARRRGRILPADLAAALTLLNALPVNTDHSELPISMLLHQAEAHGLTAYDATYFELALRLQLPLATYDIQLARAAEAAGVELLLKIF